MKLFFVIPFLFLPYLICVSSNRTHKGLTISTNYAWLLSAVNEIAREFKIKNSYSNESSEDVTANEDLHLSFEEIVTKNGYPVETHNVTTEDGYILTVYRIPHGLKESSEHRPAVFLQHGILASAFDWITLGPAKAIAYLLADNGYDVWLGNARGTTYSRKHVSLDPDKNKTEYWSFSWEEIGYYDNPSIIDYVLEKTGQSGLYHIGHSQGTTIFYVMTSLRPEYNDKIKAHFSFAPVVYMSHLTSPLVRLAVAKMDNIQKLLELAGLYELLPHTKLFEDLTQELCGNNRKTQDLCAYFFFILFGFSEDEMDASLFPNILAHTPAGISSRQVIHYGQIIKSGYFRRYDHGSSKNMIRYGSPTPPDYELSNITSPVYLFYSKNDWMSSVEDLEQLEKSLSNVKGKILINDPEFNHVDYTYGTHADVYVYDEVIEILNRIETNK